MFATSLIIYDDICLKSRHWWHLCVCLISNVKVHCLCARHKGVLVEWHEAAYSREIWREKSPVCTRNRKTFFCFPVRSPVSVLTEVPHSLLNINCIKMTETIYRSYTITRSRGSVIGIATRLRARRSGVRFPLEARDLFFSKTSRTARGPTQPPIQWVPGLFPRCKAAKVKNEWRYTGTPEWLHGLDRENLTLKDNWLSVWRW
jgi:hypothetical protein